MMPGVYKISDDLVLIQTVDFFTPIVDDEMKYGMAVTGFVHPGKILANQGLRRGDCLILTKSLGTGIISIATKGGLVSTPTILSKSLSVSISTGTPPCTGVIYGADSYNDPLLQE